jgi:hypothetical protein
VCGGLSLKLRETCPEADRKPSHSLFGAGKGSLWLSALGYTNAGRCHSGRLGVCFVFKRRLLTQAVLNGLSLKLHDTCHEAYRKPSHSLFEAVKGSVWLSALGCTNAWRCHSGSLCGWFVFENRLLSQAALDGLSLKLHDTCHEADRKPSHSLFGASKGSLWLSA